MNSSHQSEEVKQEPEETEIKKELFVYQKEIDISENDTFLATLSER